jgi:2-hydroxychromene-2-carboxylate isomerase
MHIDFYYDIVCPYAYLASTQVEALAARAGVELRWQPVLLGGLFRAVGTAQNMSASMHPSKARLNLLDMHRQAHRLGVPLAMHPKHPVRTVEAMRLLTGAPEAVRPALSHALYRAYWVEHRAVDDPAVLQAIAAEHGLDAAQIVADPEVKAGLFACTAEAAAQGAFGVPAVVVDGRLYWGADRLHLVERQLTGDAPEPDLPEGPTGAQLTFFHDFSSPYSYLAAGAIAQLASDHGATVQWRPILLGGLFRALGTADVPLLAMNAARQAYMGRDLQDWASFRQVPFRFPTVFPLRTVLPLRVALQAPEATMAIYKAAWADDRNIGDATELAAVLNEAGFDGAALVAGAADPAVKAQLRANTEAALEVGACGVPTMQVQSDDGGAPQLFWGQDRLEMVAAALRGWRLPDD